MSLTFTILGFLNHSPMTGYDLKKVMDNSTQFFWHAELSQIYPTLKSLEKDGLVDVHVTPQEGKPDRKEYSITKRGRDELIKWLQEPLDQIPATKSPVLLKFFFLGALDRADVLAQFRCQLEIQKAREIRYRQETRKLIETENLPSEKRMDRVLWEITRQYGEMQTQTSIAWLENAIHQLEAMNEDTGY
jgi:PadR family transcriptional regulator, regulatory protein AphA